MTQLLESHRHAFLPKIGEEFQLDVIYREPAVLAELAGINKGECAFIGPYFEGRSIYTNVTLQYFGVTNLAQAQVEAKKLGGRLLEGQAWESFQKRFPVPDNNRPEAKFVFFGTSEWEMSHNGVRRIACLCNKDGTWKPGLSWSVAAENGLWLVVKDERPRYRGRFL